MPDDPVVLRPAEHGVRRELGFVRAKRSKSGAVSFDLLAQEDSNAARPAGTIGAIAAALAEAQAN